jgi:hypothetical protein
LVKKSKPIAARWRPDGRREWVAKFTQRCAAGERCVVGDLIRARRSWIVSSADGKFLHTECVPDGVVAAALVRRRARVAKRRRRYEPPRPVKEAG